MIKMRQNKIGLQKPTKLSLRIVIACIFLSATALAGNIRYQASHTTSKSPEQLWKIMIDYRQTCDKGCKYQRPDLVVVKKLSYKSSPNSWYTWSHVSSTFRDVRFFTHVTVSRQKDGNIIANNRQVSGKDKTLVAELEKRTGLKHSPAFDAGNTQTITRSIANGKTKMTQVVTLTASGVLAMWEGKIRENMKRSVMKTFENIGK